MPTRVYFGKGSLGALETAELPGKKALIVISRGGSVVRSGLLSKVEAILGDRKTEYEIYDGIKQNPTRESIMEAAEKAKASGCDFILGLGGGSCLDSAKAIAVMAVSDGDLWDYGYTGSGLKKPIEKAAAVVLVTTTAGTGSETDPGCVITKTETGEKLDFIGEAMFPVFSIIDPELMKSLPRDYTLYQGFDALFHCAECYITNQNENPMVDMFAEKGVRTVAQWLQKAADDGGDMEARSEMAFAADVCAGYCMSLIGTTSHHIVAQTMGGMFPDFVHGASLIVMCEEYYRRIEEFVPDTLDRLGEMMGEEPDPVNPGTGFVRGLVALMEKTGMRFLPMSSFGIRREDIPKIADYAVNRTGIEDVDIYKLTQKDIEDILTRSYR